MPPPIVALIAARPGLPDRLLSQHTDDGTGHCEICTSGGGAGHLTWPCRLWGIADQARALAAANTAGRRPAAP